MAKIRLTKNELKIQRDSLKRFQRYLPILQLKKQQLQVEIGKVDRQIEQLDNHLRSFLQEIDQWVDVFAEEIDLARLIQASRINTDTGNIAGVDMPLFVSVDFKRQDYDYLTTPFWIDPAIEALEQLITQKAKQLILKKQRAILQEELRITTQRVNLFENVKIPAAQENIRIIQIHLGDLQTAGVVRGKIAKAKIEQRRELVSV